MTAAELRQTISEGGDNVTIRCGEGLAVSQRQSWKAKYFGYMAGRVDGESGETCQSN